MDFFFYGTLMDADVRRRVLGRDLRPAQIEEAELPGYRTVYLAGASYPGVIAESGRAAPGLLVHGLGPSDAARLTDFEGPQYHNRALAVTARGGGSAKAHVFVPRAGVATRDADWTLDAWRRRFKARFLSRPSVPADLRPGGRAGVPCGITCHSGVKALCDRA